MWRHSTTGSKRSQHRLAHSTALWCRFLTPAHTTNSSLARHSPSCTQQRACIPRKYSSLAWQQTRSPKHRTAACCTRTRSTEPRTKQQARCERPASTHKHLRFTHLQQTPRIVNHGDAICVLSSSGVVGRRDAVAPFRVTFHPGIHINRGSGAIPHILKHEIVHDRIRLETGSR
jgi:hypothetical protein